MCRVVREHWGVGLIRKERFRLWEGCKDGAGVSAFQNPDLMLHKGRCAKRAPLSFGGLRLFFFQWSDIN